ncbi:hypothetical protein [Pontimicrobium sp. IMCC45349]|uniref:hypothetical protein n=1 Tax=Pontimicrobium sp. IMCC45349 TaxID=3391574 RepID=UPI0039A3DC65
MKTVIKKVLVIVVLFTTLLSNASKSSSLTVLDDDRTTTLELNNVKQGDLLRVIDSKGSLLYKERISATGNYYKGFDLSHLPNGNYHFELVKDFEIKIIPFEVLLNKVLINKKAETSIFKPSIRVNDYTILINKLSLNNNPVTIKVFFENLNDYELIYSDIVTNSTSISKSIKLDKKIKGEYKIIIESDNKIYTKNIRI